MKLLYFAWVRQKIGRSDEEYTANPPVSTVAELMEQLKQRGGGYAEAFADPARLRCAVNQTHTGFETRIAPGDEIAFFPPVTGG